MEDVIKGLYSELNTDKKFRFNLDELTVIRILKGDQNAYKQFRSCSTKYGGRVYVKKYLLEKYKNKCRKCGSSKDLEVDHIIPVKKCFDLKLFTYCNTLKNLQILCRSCNNKKSNL